MGMDMNDSSCLWPLLIEPRVEWRLDTRFLFTLQHLLCLDVDYYEVVGFEVTEAVATWLDYALVRAWDTNADVARCSVCQFLTPYLPADLGKALSEILFNFVHS